LKKYDVIVIGAGPAGSISAAKLNKHGFSVLVLEKMQFPRFVIGESLLPKCMDYLEELDLLSAIEAENFQKKTGATFFHNDLVCEFDFKNKYTKGWSYTYQVKRADFDHALIKAIEAKGVEVEFNATVISVDAVKERQIVEYTDLDENILKVKSRFLIDASGNGRVLPKLFNLQKPVESKSRGAVFAHVTDTNKSFKEATNIYVQASEDNASWAWSIPFSDKTCSVGIVGDSEYIEECAKNNSENFLDTLRKFPSMKERFIESDLLFDPMKIINFSVAVTKLHGDGFVLCGNATEFLDPIFSSGVTLAMSSGYLGAELAIKELNGETVNWEKEYSDTMNAGIDVFRTYVNAWYSNELHQIIFAPKINELYKKQICSVLAGYVWDTTNPFVKKHKTLISTLAKVIKITS
jgi:flavin-dependent dehydrogenase